MGGFFPHTGGSPSGYSVLPTSTFNTILDDIVADLNSQGGSVNGWSLHDDQRTGFTPLILPVHVGGLNNQTSNQIGIVATNGSAAITQTSYGSFQYFITGASGTQISWDQTNWYYCSAITSQVAATLDRNYTGTTLTGSTGHNWYEKSGAYIVLKCTSSQKTFYVLLARQVSYAVALRVQIFETWNAGTHTGTAGGPQESLRAFENGQGRAGTAALQYIFFALPDTFGLWLSGSPAESGVVKSDFFYAGNLTPLRVGDSTCLLQACTHQGLSGIGSTTSPALASTGSLGLLGGASCLRTIAGVQWVDPRAVDSYDNRTNYAVVPRGSPYFFGLDRTNLDDAAKFQFCEFDAYYGGLGGSGFDKNEGKRGELKYLKCPVSNPSGMHLASLGPADDGNTYLLLRMTGSPLIPGNPTSVNGDVLASGASASGFSYAVRTGTSGEVVVASVSAGFSPKWLMMPINL